MAPTKLALLLASLGGSDALRKRHRSQTADLQALGASNPVPSADAFVHLFEWKWSDIAQECEQWLAPKGYSAVQISPPTDHRVGNPWWVRYQPVTYDLISRSGNESEFRSMVQRCKAVGVGIYADAVINHIAGGSGTSFGGSSYGGRASPIYSPRDFHNQGDPLRNCGVDNYYDRFNVQYCDLLGLPDLCTSCDYVQGKIAEYINYMGQIGIAGFRIDASKHMDAGELEQLLGRVNSSLWLFHEVIAAGGEPITPQEYLSSGDSTEFNYFRELDKNINVPDKLQYLGSFGEAFGLIDTNSAVVFIDNHDTQRYGDAPATYKNGAMYGLFNVFMLAHPYGYPKVMSSYYYNNKDDGPPSANVHRGGGNTRCFDGSTWVCEHRWNNIANMVNWRKSAGTAWLDNFQAPSGNTIAFCRGGRACVALNRGGGTWNANVYFSVPAGSYCDVIQSDDTSSCPRIQVDSNGRASFQVPSIGAVAVHVGKKAR